jgi:tetratricopeptide (TPR) repeat protein
MSFAHLWLPALVAVTTLQTTDPVGDFSRGRALLQAGNPAGAVTELEKAVAALPTWGLAQIELAEALMAAGESPERQEKALEEARKLLPDNPRAWVLSARWLERNGKPEDAIGACRKALELSSNLVDTRIQLGLLLAQLGRPSEAIPVLQQAISERPQERGLRANLADAYEKTGNLFAAEAQLRELFRLSGGSPVFANRLAAFYERTGQSKKAAGGKRSSKQVPHTSARKMRPLPDSRR